MLAESASLCRVVIVLGDRVPQTPYGASSSRPGLVLLGLDRVCAGIDPVTNKPRYLAETAKGTDHAAWRRTEKAMTRFVHRSTSSAPPRPP